MRFITCLRGIMELPGLTTQLNLTAVSSNISSSSELFPSSSMDSRGVPAAVILSLCFLLGVPGNIAVIIVKPNFQQLSSMTQSLMLNLAVSDLLCLLTLPLWIYSLLYNWIFGLLACKILAYLVYCSVYGSLLTVVLLSFQRYMLVVHQQFQTKMRLCLVLLWPVSLILSIPALVVRQEIPDEQWVRCSNQYSSQPQMLAVLLTETLLGFAAFFIVAFSYIQLYRKVNRAAFFNNPQTSRLVTSIIIVFFVLWIPYHTMNVLSVVATALHDARLDKRLSEFWYIVLPLTFINSCLNPLLYVSHFSRSDDVVTEALPKTVSFNQNSVKTNVFLFPPECLFCS
uniref:G-protein coupled receptors family 1 profile domain-containing protein n=1 Tax=Oryzias latipes TaxID=8090 RepID=A0A3B3HUW9_ORYLA